MEGSHNCPENSRCSDTVGSFSCECDFGFAWDGSSCVETSDCNGLCSQNSRCVNNMCVCQPGFRKDGNSCININECQEGLDDCADNAECIDSQGSFFCRCVPPFVGDGRTCTNQVQCEEGCSLYAECVNDVCSCKPGFHGNGEFYYNANECREGTHKCSPFATCTDFVGSYSCSCNTGFYR